MQRPEFHLMTEFAVRLCDVCSEMCGDRRVATFVSGVAVSDICLDCASDIANTVTPADGLAVPSDNASNLCAECSRTFGSKAALGSHARTHRLVLA